MRFSRVYGYVRVSTKDQNEDRQVIAMKKEGIKSKHIYVEKQSGKDFERPIYQKLKSVMREGDVLYVLSLDRLGRNYEEIIQEWRELTKQKGIDVVVLDMPVLDTRQHKDLLGTLIADLVLQIMSYVAETERAQIRERQRQGIAAAKARGVVFGRPRASARADIDDVIRRWRRREFKASVAAEMCGFSESTFYKRVKAYDQDRGHPVKKCT